MSFCNWEQDGGSANTGHWAVSSASQGGQTRSSIELHFGQWPGVPAWGEGQLSPEIAEPGPFSLAEPKERVYKVKASGQRCETVPQLLTLNHHMP